MTNLYLSNIQIYYTKTPRHWCPHSEKYTGADSLVSALRDEWSVCRIVYRQDVLHGGTRRTPIYFFELKRDGQVMTMPVIGTPFIVRFIASYHLRVVHTDISEKQDIRTTAEEPVLQQLALA